jgi:hypothetical protein
VWALETSRIRNPGPTLGRSAKRKVSSVPACPIPDKKHVCHKTPRIKLNRQRTGFLWTRKLRERHVTIKPDLISATGIIPYRVPENSNFMCQNYKN